LPKNPKAKTNPVYSKLVEPISIEAPMLKQVAEGLWFPSSGCIGSPDEERVNVFQTTSKIVVNQGLTEKDFDIEFPPGTEVRDDIKGRKYVIKSR